MNNTLSKIVVTAKRHPAIEFPIMLRIEFNNGGLGKFLTCEETSTVIELLQKAIDHVKGAEQSVLIGTL